MNDKKGYNSREHIEVLFVDVTGKSNGDKEPLQVLENAINEKLSYLQGSIKSPAGGRFSVEILDVKYVSTNVAMIITNTKMSSETYLG